MWPGVGPMYVVCPLTSHVAFDVQWVVSVLRSAPRRRFCELCQARPLPAAPCPFRAPLFRAGPFGGVDPPEHCAASWLYSSNRNPLGNCMDARPETGLGSDSARPRLLSSRLASQFLSRNTGTTATPSRGTGDICLRVTRATEGRAAPVATFLSPVARDYPSRALGGFFMPPRCDCSIKER